MFKILDSNTAQQEPSNMTGYHLSCLAITSIFAIFGGLGAHFATQGLNPEAFSRFRNWKLVPLIKGFIFPTLLAHLIWGAIARNGLSEYYDENYDDLWGSWIRSAGIACIFIRVGGELDFSGKGVVFLLYSTIPNILEAIVCAVAANFFLNIPWIFAISLGFLITVCGAAIVVPPTLKYRELKYSPHVCDLLLSSMAFSVSFSIASWIIFNSVAIIVYGQSNDSISMMIVNIFVQIFAGIGSCLILSTFLIPFKNTHKYIRTAVIIILLETLMWFFTYYQMPIGTVLSNIFFGYFIKFTLPGCVPTREIRYCWFFAMPFLFGHVGCQLDLRKLSANSIMYSILTVILCLIGRSIGSIIICSMDKKFTMTERLYVAIASFTKATAQSSFSVTLAVLATTNASLGNLVEEGNNYLTCSIMSTMIGGPLGAILMENIGAKLLTLQERCSENYKPLLKISDGSTVITDHNRSTIDKKHSEDEKAQK